MSNRAKFLYSYLVLAVLLAISIQVNPVDALNSKEYLAGNVSVYGIDGYGVNVSLTIEQPIFTANSTTIAYSLKIYEPFSARDNIVKGSDYSVTRKTLSFYLTSGVAVDYDRSRVIDILWLNWGDSSNNTYAKEENSLYKQIYWVNISRSDETYFGSVTLPNLSEGNHNATIWVRAEQDQVTTFIPFWIAVSQTIELNNPAPTPTVPEISNIIALVVVFSAVSLVVAFSKKRFANRAQVDVACWMPQGFINYFARLLLQVRVD